VGVSLALCQGEVAGGGMLPGYNQTVDWTVPNK